jgi:hypothetical protein
VPQLVKFYEKRTILLTAIALAALIPPIPLLLFINGYLPEPGTWNLFFATISFVYIAN